MTVQNAHLNKAPEEPTPEPAPTLEPETTKKESKKK